ncbi:hypothetical protein [Candidatus Clostridium stratigraminis]|uniref:Lipoprotein n=1 Tax=Candidatus Clostridium stratigraminis TaxID=3381661 RepID=A0ABW8T6E3_9CLOT
MKFNKYFFVFIVILVTIPLIGCSKQVLLNESNSNLLNYNFKITNLKNIDKTLSNQKYGYSTDPNRKYAAVIIYQGKKASMNQYLVNKSDIVNLNIPKDSFFIISLHANCTIASSWNIKNNIDNGIIQFQNRSWIDIPMPKSEKGKPGLNYNRQNFYFKTLKLGSQKIIMRYEHEVEEIDEPFEINFNIKINE